MFGKNTVYLKEQIVVMKPIIYFIMDTLVLFCFIKLSKNV